MNRNILRLQILNLPPQTPYNFPSWTTTSHLYGMTEDYCDTFWGLIGHISGLQRMIKYPHHFSRLLALYIRFVFVNFALNCKQPYPLFTCHQQNKMFCTYVHSTSFSHLRMVFYVKDDKRQCNMNEYLNLT